MYCVNLALFQYVFFSFGTSDSGQLVGLSISAQFRVVLKIRQISLKINIITNITTGHINLISWGCSCQISSPTISFSFLIIRKIFLFLQYIYYIFQKCSTPFENKQISTIKRTNF